MVRKQVVINYKGNMQRIENGRWSWKDSRKRERDRKKESTKRKCFAWVKLGGKEYFQWSFI